MIEARKENTSCVQFEGVRKSNQDAETSVRRRVWRGPMKTNYSDLKFHLLTDHLLHQSSTLMLSFPSWDMTILRAHFAWLSAGCFEDDKRKENSVTRGDKFALSLVESFFQPPQCAECRSS